MDRTVYILPMRNWNRCNSQEIFRAMLVYILPMRNWNQVHKFAPDPRDRSLYLTYEELKLTKENKNEITNKFISYLWGIEIL